MKLRHVLAGICAAAIATCSAASANTIQTLLLNPPGIVDNGNGTFTYNYQIEITGNNGLTASGAFHSGLIILDVPGLVGAPSLSSTGTDITLAADWSLTTPLTGSGGALSNSGWGAGEATLDGSNTGNQVKGNDSAGIENIVLEYIGADVAATGSNQNLIHLSLTSVYGTSGPILSLSRDTQGSTLRPAASYFTEGPAVPLPAAAWGGMALLGVLGATQAARRRSMK